MHRAEALAAGALAMLAVACAASGIALVCMGLTLVGVAVSTAPAGALVLLALCRQPACASRHQRQAVAPAGGVTATLVFSDDV